jgi:hypothetical protein
MSDVEMTTQLVDKGARRWSEPVRLGEILAELLDGIETCGAKVAPQSRVQAVVNARLRKAG